MISQFKIPLNHFIQNDGSTYYYVNGVLHKTRAVELDPGLLNYSLAEREKGKSAAQLFSEALWKVSAQRDSFDVLSILHFLCVFFFANAVVCVQVRDDLGAVGCSAMMTKYDSYTVKVKRASGVTRVTG